MAASKKINAAASGRVQSEVQKPVGQVLEVPTRLIRPDPNQPRQFFSAEELKTLEESIQRDGQLNPIHVIAISDPDHQFQIVAGERRWRALQRLGIGAVRVEVLPLDQAKDRLKILDLQTAENTQRAALSDLELAKTCQRYREDHGLKDKAIGSRVGCSEGRVTQLRSILTLAPAILERYFDPSQPERRMNVLVAVALTQVKDLAEQLQLAQRAMGEGGKKPMRVEEVRAMVRFYLESQGIERRKLGRPAAIPRNPLFHVLEMARRLEAEMKVTNSALDLPQSAFDQIFAELTPHDLAHLIERFARGSDHLDTLIGGLLTAYEHRGGSVDYLLEQLPVIARLRPKRSSAKNKPVA